MNLENYLELIVPIHQDARWFKALKCVMRGMITPKDWNKEHFHITVAFMNSDSHVSELKEAFEKVIDGRKALSLTLDKLDVFETRRAKDYVIYIDASKKSDEMLALIEDLRSAARGVGAEIEDFKFHITLVQKNIPNKTIEDIQRAISTIKHKPSFTVTIDKAEYHYYDRNFKKRTDHWPLL